MSSIAAADPIIAQGLASASATVGELAPPKRQVFEVGAESTVFQPSGDPIENRIFVVSSEQRVFEA
jgi:hypothetical protein